MFLIVFKQIKQICYHGKMCVSKVSIPAQRCFSAFQSLEVFLRAVGAAERGVAVPGTPEVTCRDPQLATAFFFILPGRSNGNIR